MTTDNPNLTPKQALFIGRIMWAALLAGLIFMGVILGIVVGPTKHARPSDSDWIFPAMGFAMVFTMVPIGLFIRGQTFKRGWVGDVITPQAYNGGNILAWACCEGPAFASLIFYFITANPLALVPYGLGILALLLLFPNGKAMLPHPPAGAENPYEARR